MLVMKYYPVMNANSVSTYGSLANVMLVLIIDWLLK